MNEILTDNIVCVWDRHKTGFVTISRLCLQGGGGGGLKPSANRHTFINIGFMRLSFSNEITNIITNFLPEFEFISIFTFYLIYIFVFQILIFFLLFFAMFTVFGIPDIERRKKKEKSSHRPATRIFVRK